MKSANTSILREYGLAPEKTIDKLENLSSEQRKIRVGLLQRKVKGLSRKMETGFNDIVARFIEINGLTENDIVSIKRDAVFIRAKTPKYTTVGKYCTFRPKNEYVAFLLIGGFEIYMRADRSFDIKGMEDSKIPLHDDGMLEFIRNFLFDFDYDMPGLHQYCKDYVAAYKNLELPLNCYREFNQDSGFRFRSQGTSYTMANINEDTLSRIDIVYNYQTVILPMIQFLL